MNKQNVLDVKSDLVVGMVATLMAAKLLRNSTEPVFHQKIDLIERMVMDLATRHNAVDVVNNELKRILKEK